MVWGEEVTLDVDLLKSLGKFVVHCETKQQADELLELVGKCFPDKLIGWTKGITYWDWYKGESCYALHMDRPKATMQFSPVHYWKEHGYSIVPFYDLIVPFDYGEIQNNTCFELNLLYEIGV